MTEELSALQRWYLAQCDGGWEHQNGIEINTLDNPGWRIVINLAGTELAGAAYEAVEENYDHDTHWLRCSVADGKFQAAGGPLMLSRMPRIFLDWTSQAGTPGRR